MSACFSRKWGSRFKCGLGRPGRDVMIKKEKASLGGQSRGSCVRVCVCVCVCNVLTWDFDHCLIHVRMPLEVVPLEDGQWHNLDCAFNLCRRSNTNTHTHTHTHTHSAHAIFLLFCFLFSYIVFHIHFPLNSTSVHRTSVCQILHPDACFSQVLAQTGLAYFRQDPTACSVGHNVMWKLYQNQLPLILILCFLF